MSVRVRLNESLREYAHCRGVLEAGGNTIMECLNDLVEQYPRLKEWLFDADGSLQVLIRINEGAIVTRRESLNSKVQDGDEISIFMIFHGG